MRTAESRRLEMKIGILVFAVAVAAAAIVVAPRQLERYALSITIPT